METISGLSNWRLTVQRKNNEICILRACTCDADAVLPDELWGLPVTELSSRALAPSAKELNGESVIITCGRAQGEWDNRNIRTLTLPEKLRTAGAYAFMNCSALETLRLHDELNDLSSSAFMNCRSFRRIELTRCGDRQGAVLANILSWLSTELDVSIYGHETSRLIFPEYYEAITESGPTHFFTYTLEGAGYAYHNVFKNRELTLSDYDALWEKYLATDYEPDTALQIAWWRLRYPAGLSENARAAYLAHIYSHADAAIAFALKNKDMDGLRLILSSDDLKRETLDAAQTLARDMQLTEATAILLEQQHRRFASSRKKSFDI